MEEDNDVPMKEVSTERTERSHEFSREGVNEIIVASLNDKKYPKFRISSIYDFLECEKRFYLIETGKAIRMVTPEMVRGRNEHALFEEKVMALPEAIPILDLRDGFIKAKEFGRPVISSEIPLKIQDHDFQLYISGKIDGIEISPKENTVRIIENKPRLSEYAVAQGILYAYTAKKILREFSPEILIEIRKTKNQEVFADKSYGENDERTARQFLEKISLILHQKVHLHEMRRCSLPECVCTRIWW